MNPINIVKNFLTSGGNLEQLIMKTVQSNSNSNPMINNLVQMAQKGNKQGVEEFARNFFKERGRDFDKEYAEFMKNFKG